MTNLSVIGNGPWADVYRQLYGRPETPKYEQPQAVVVCNKTSMHESEAERWLRWKIPALVEKPMALSAAGAQDLIVTAKRHDAYLAAAHVLKFDRRFDELAKQVEPRANDIWKIVWTDPANGRYDPRVLIETDVLPHVVTIIDTLLPGQPIFCDGVTFGGHGRDLRLMAGKVTIDVTMARDSIMRQRLVWTPTAQLDFSKLSPDHNPLRDLIERFIHDVETGERDERLSPALGVKACRVTDDCLEKVERYREVGMYVGP